MYNEWTEVDLSLSSQSVLAKFSNATGLVVANAVVEELLHQLNANTMALDSDSAVKWCMEVLCYAFSLPLNSNYAIVSKSVQICCEWLCCMCDAQRWSPVLPQPLKVRSEFYATELLNHLQALFAFQWIGGVEADAVRRRVRDCEKALTHVRQLAADVDATLRPSIYPVVLRFLLSAVHNLLSFPFCFDEELETLCTLAMRILFIVWLRASVHRYPSPDYWKTLHLLCLRWRYRIPVVEVWSNVCLALTNRLVQQLYGLEYSKMKIEPEDEEFLPTDCSDEAFSHIWFRVLTLFGNVGSFLQQCNLQECLDKTPDGLEPAVDPSGSPVRTLPGMSNWSYCYFIVVYTLNLVVSGLLGIHCQSMRKEVDPDWQTSVTAVPAAAATAATVGGGQSAPVISQTGSFLKAAIKSGLPVGTKAKDAKQQQQTTTAVPKPASPVVPTSADVVRAVLKGMLVRPAFGTPLPKSKPAVDSVLRLTGTWLFDICHSISEPSNGLQPAVERSVEARAAKAIAIIALSKVFCYKFSQERICVKYVSRYVAVIRQTAKGADPMIVSSMLVYIADLFRVNLAGVERAWPDVLGAVERLLSDAIRHQLMVKESCLQLACLHLLSSSVVYPFCDGQVFAADEPCPGKATLVQYCPTQWNVLRLLLSQESDSSNLQLCVHLMAAHCAAYLAWSAQNAAEAQCRCMALVDSTVISLAETLNRNKSSDFAVCLSIYDTLSTMVALLPSGVAAELTAYEQLLFIVCRVIQDQLALPALSHSRDMHSTVVAAFNFLESLLLRFPTLLRNNACLESVCSIIVVGLYGSDVQDCRQLNSTRKKPASQRVHDAADQLLHCIFCRVGDSFQPVSAVQNENYLLECVADRRRPGDVKFIYILFNNTVLAVNELQYVDDDAKETGLIFRTPFVTATCQLYKLSTCAVQQPVAHSGVSGAPHGRCAEKPPRRPVPNFLISDVDMSPRCKADLSIPEIRMDDRKSRMLSMMRTFERQYKEERRRTTEGGTEGTLNASPQCHGTGTHRARLLLFDLGVTQFTDGDQKAEFQLLDSESDDFRLALASLDRTPCRHVCTVHIFYVTKGRCAVQDILANGDRLDSTDGSFLRFLSDLGHAMAINEEAIWTGHWSTAYGIAEAGEASSEAVRRFLFDGRSHLIYWSSPNAEIAFLVPSSRTECSVDGSATAGLLQERPTRPPRSQRSTAGETTGVESVRQWSVKAKRPPLHQDYRFFVVWLECFEDNADVAVEELIHHSDTGEPLAPPCTVDSLYVLYICRLANGLYRLKLTSPQSKLGCVGPISDGFVLSLQLLAPFVRHTVLNAATRRRLEQEGHVSPAQRRRQKIAEIGARFASQQRLSDQLFQLLTF